MAIDEFLRQRGTKTAGLEQQTRERNLTQAFTKIRYVGKGQGEEEEINVAFSWKFYIRECIFGMNNRGPLKTRDQNETEQTWTWKHFKYSNNSNSDHGVDVNYELVTLFTLIVGAREWKPVQRVGKLLYLRAKKKWESNGNIALVVGHYKRKRMRSYENYHRREIMNSHSAVRFIIRFAILSWFSNAREFVTIFVDGIYRYLPGIGVVSSIFRAVADVSTFIWYIVKTGSVRGNSGKINLSKVRPTTIARPHINYHQWPHSFAGNVCAPNVCVHGNEPRWLYIRRILK